MSLPNFEELRRRGFITRPPEADLYEQPDAPPVDAEQAAPPVQPQEWEQNLPDFSGTTKPFQMAPDAAPQAPRQFDMYGQQQQINQKAAQGKTLANIFGNFGSDLARGISGQQLPQREAPDLAKTAAEYNKGSAEEQALQDAMRDRDVKAARAKSLADPNSPESQYARELFLKLTGKTAEEFGPRFNQMAGAQLPGVSDMMKSLPAADHQRIMAGLEQKRIDATNRHTAAYELSLQGKTEKELRERAGNIERLGLRPDATEAEIKAALRAEDAKTTAAIDEAKSRRLQQSAADLTRETTGAKQDYEKTVGLPVEYELVDGANPSNDDKKQFSKLVMSDKKMRGLIGELRQAMAGTNGWQRVFDPAVRSRLQEIAKKLTIETKNVAELGALSGPDLGLTDAIAKDPTGVPANLFGTIEANLKDLEAWGPNSVSAGMETYGLRKKTGPVANTPSAKTDKRYSATTGKTYTVQGDKVVKTEDGDTRGK